MKKIIVIGSILAGTAVILGALNAHALKAYFTPDTTSSFATGVRYQMYHALAILLLGTLNSYLGNRASKRVLIFFLSGTILFSGSIYALCVLKSNGIIGLTGLGILTPIGGVLLIIGWLSLIISALKK